MPTVTNHLRPRLSRVRVWYLRPAAASRHSGLAPMGKENPGRQTPPGRIRQQYPSLLTPPPCHVVEGGSGPSAVRSNAISANHGSNKTYGGAPQQLSHSSAHPDLKKGQKEEISAESNSRLRHHALSYITQQFNRDSPYHSNRFAARQSRE